MGPLSKDSFVETHMLWKPRWWGPNWAFVFSRCQEPTFGPINQSLWGRHLWLGLILVLLKKNVFFWGAIVTETWFLFSVVLEGRQILLKVGRDRLSRSGLERLEKGLTPQGGVCSFLRRCLPIGWFNLSSFWRPLTPAFLAQGPIFFACLGFYKKENQQGEFFWLRVFLQNLRSQQGENQHFLLVKTVAQLSEPGWRCVVMVFNVERFS